MPRRQGRNEQYDFTNARDRAAFEALLAEEEEEDAQGGAARTATSHKGNGGSAAKPKREKQKFFALKDPGGTPQDGTRRDSSTNATVSDMLQLQELFGGAADDELLAAVYEQCGRSLPAAVDALLGLLGQQQQQPAASSSSKQQSSARGSSTSRVPKEGGHTTDDDGVERGWEVLPEDCRSAVLGRLSLREMARAASVCRGWAARCAALQAAITALVLQPGLSYAAVKGCIVRCSHAAVVDLTRLQRRAPAAAPNASPAAASEVTRMQRQEAEAEVFRVVVALAEGLTRPRGAPVRGLVLAGLTGATDAVLTEALRGIPTLRSLDLSRCPLLTSQALLLLSKYRAADTAVEAVEGPSDIPAAAAADPVQGASSSSTTTTNHAITTAAVTAAMSADLSALSLAQQQQQQQQQERGGGGRRSRDTGGLHSLLLAGNSQLADFGVAAVVQGPATRGSLQHLDVSYCSGLGSDALQLPPTGVLEQLVARHLGAGMKALSLQLPSSHPLQLLDLSGCAYLRELNLVTPHLTSLHINNAASLHRLRLNCARLTHLSATHCGELAELFEDAWSTPALQHLNLFGCRALHQVHHVLRGCPALATLNCNGCTSMNQLLLRDQPALTNVDVSGCSRLLVLEVDSPALRHCHASACGQMQRLVLTSSSLSSLLLTNCRRLSAVVVPEVYGVGHDSRQGAAAGKQLSTRGCEALRPGDLAALKQLMAAA